MLLYRVLALVALALASASAFSQSPLTLSREEKLQRLNAMLTQVKLPEIKTLDSIRLIADIPKYMNWAGIKPSEGMLLIPKPDSVPVARITYPKFVERYFRATPSKVEIVQQPNTILVQQGSSLIPIVNPDALLVRFSVATTWGDVFPSVVDIHDQIKTFKDAKVDLRDETGLLCGEAKDTANQTAKEKEDMERKLVNCIMRTGPSNRFFRLAGGFKTQFNYGQNPQIQQNINVGGTPAATANYSLSGQIDFDPKGIFLNGTDWNNGYESAVADKQLAIFQKRVEKRCGEAYGVTDKCIRRLSGLTTNQMAAAVLIPQFSASIKNQFDYVKQSGFLVAAPYPTKALYDITLTVDPSRLFPSAKQRQDALKVLTALKKNPTKDGAPMDDASKDSRTSQKTEVLRLYVGFASEPEELDRGSWYEDFRNALCKVLVTTD